MPDREDTPLSFPLPSGVADTVATETCANCRSICPIGDTDTDGICRDCREISNRAHALNAPARDPLPDRPEPWWNRD